MNIHLKRFISLFLPQKRSLIEMEKNCAVILAGGEGKRMKSSLPKPMLKVLGVPMLDWVIEACKNADVSDICVVKGSGADIIEEYLGERYYTVLQAERKGTGHAVMQAENYLAEHIGGNTLVLCGDAPFIDSETIRNALEIHENNGNAVTVITAMLDNPTGYGRIIRKGSEISGIVEQKDADDEQLEIKEINSGAYWFDTQALIAALKELKPENSQGEYYLTDTIGILISKKLRAGAYISTNPNVALGANDRMGLLKLNDIARMSVITKLMADGVEFTCLDGVSIGKDVKIGAGTTIRQGTIIEGKTIIGHDCVIGPNSLISECMVGNGTVLNSVQAYDSFIGDDTKIGPFVHIRPNSTIKNGVKIGDFVEVKNSTIDDRTSIAHLTYIGDSDAGKHDILGCGVVTVNYDGVKKARTTIGDNSFIGCNTNLIAPVSIGEGSYTAAGSTITKDVPDGALGIERGNMRVIEGFADRKLENYKKK